MLGEALIWDVTTSDFSLKNESALNTLKTVKNTILGEIQEENTIYI